tara:strand:+ start:300 stop:683 length:384 start_codon:yes stop_codon:yes gene_type:complete
MTSVLNVDTIAAKDGTSPATLTKQQAAKAWASFVMYSSFSTRDTFGASSLTDNGTGDCRINLSNSMSDSNYAVFGSGCDSVTSHNAGQRAGGGFCPSSSVAGICFTYSNNNKSDPELGHGLVHGDLA